MESNCKVEISMQTHEVKLMNGNITLLFDKNGFAYSLKFHGQECLDNLTGEPTDPDRNHSFYCDYHTNGKTVNLKPKKIKIIENTANIIHISFIDNTQALGLAYHFILKKSEDKIYSYVKAWNNIAQPFAINELRTVYRLDPNLFKIGFNGERSGFQPSSKEMMAGKKLQDETFLMKNGSLYDNSLVYSKYDYAGYFKDTNVWGQFGDNIGLWILTPDKSFYSCGPLNQDLMLHYDGLVLNYLVSEHFGKGLFTVPSNWSKVYGPWVIYLNNGSVKDAQNQAIQEKKDFPYPWLNEKDMITDLANINGKIDSNISSTYRMILTTSDPSKEPINQQKLGFTYDTCTQIDGSYYFTDIKYGHYWLCAYAIDGADFDTHVLDEIEVNCSQITEKKFDLNSHEKILWQIGQSSHTTAGFKFSDQLRNYCWQNLVPDNLDYVIGESTDWYYLQNDRGRWRIHFDLEHNEQNENIILSFAFAGVTTKNMKNGFNPLVEVTINKKYKFSHEFNNDRSAYRSALKSGNYHLWQISLKDEILQSHNIITIKTTGYIMYDSIKLSERE
ncbi:polysaccharide lyase family protein [Lactobacillus sp. ESL0703]|uniref:polysaccharide lyase family protein n=1 Tax=Lactobacillus sp. ESL0703 TaxID=2983218 RepID=UPI0023F8EF46|nr:polysaccharide lyase family protein [Lactobacillus sp. ESL0703]MDF7669101.1 polysaccharide lyase family protein [Lactobacillus sp. ESL0703]